MNTFLLNLLEHYKITVKDLSARKAPGSFKNLTVPYENKDFLAVIRRLEQAIQTNEKTVLYGDYDVDGLTSVAILKMALEKRGLHVGYFIPSRYKEGYGLNKDRVKEFKEKGYHLIVTLDNGVNAFESIQLAKELGMDVLVVDHHSYGETFPPFDGLFHQKASGFLSYNCSAASLSFFLSSYLKKAYSHYDAFLAGLAVFSDVMPLVGNNLELAKLALYSINQFRFPNFTSLYNQSHYSYDDFSFHFIPSLNSVGRISLNSKDVNEACHFLMEKENREIYVPLANQINTLNEKRKKIVSGYVFDESKHLSTLNGDCYQMEGYSGLAGLFANRLLREKKHSVLVVSTSEKDESCLVGSLRMEEGMSGLAFLKNYSSLFLEGGGHDLACGITFKKEKYFQVATSFLSECEKQVLERKDDKKENNQAILITKEDINRENYEIYASFFPFGEGFKAPSFTLTLSREELKTSPNNKALYCVLPEGKVLYFGAFDNLLSQSRYESFTFTGRFEKEVYKGTVSYQLVADKMEGELF